MCTSKRLFGTNGVRGLTNVVLTPDVAVKIGLAIGIFFGKKKLVLGHDARTSGSMSIKAIISGLTAAMCNVCFAGMAPTPSLQFAVKNHKMDGTVIVTASHNPAEYNGIKVIWSEGIETSHEHEVEIERLYFDNRFSFTSLDKLGEVKELSGIINNEYISAIKTHVDVEKISEKHFHIVVDTANNVGGLTTPFLMRDIGCKVTSINTKNDGTFPGRQPEPCRENLYELAATVKTTGVDIGVAFDVDVDRAKFVDENGEVYMGDKTFAIILKYFLLKNKGTTVVTPVSSSTLIKEIADTYNGKFEWTKVGSVTVSHKMMEINAKLGGEENGGVFYEPHQAVRDGAMTTTLLLEIMAEMGKKLSGLIAEQPQYFIE
ncbi:MAG: phosphoglucosamine mutase, partial [Nitrososphaerota archaeon]|nr:phosphoglucosamine mutase [Nitrososphaerota archaeon]